MVTKRKTRKKTRRSSKWKRIRKQGLSGKKYIFYRDGKRDAVIVNKYGKGWWNRATVSDMKRVTVH